MRACKAAMYLVSGMFRHAQLLQRMLCASWQDISRTEPYDVDEAQQQDDLNDEEEARQHPCNLQGASRQLQPATVCRARALSGCHRSGIQTPMATTVQSAHMRHCSQLHSLATTHSESVLNAVSPGHKCQRHNLVWQTWRSMCPSRPEAAKAASLCVGAAWGPPSSRHPAGTESARQRR